VFINLLSNAIKFTNVGTVTVLAKINNKTDNTVSMYFEIKDSGIGMTREHIKKVFVPFTQAEISTTRKYGGTGLGLSITRNLVDLMGGTLVVESTPGIGSKFSFELTFDTIDVTDDRKLEKKLLMNKLKKPTFSGEILLCEDNAMNQQVICEHLARVGIKTVVAWNGKIGVDMVRGRMLSGEKQFDLVFMDMHMPVMDGLEASTRILKLNANIPVIAMTANVMSDDRELYRKNGLQDCVGKPFTSQELWRCLLKYFKPISFEGGESQADGGARFRENKILEKDGMLEADLEFIKSLKLTFLRNNKNKFDEITKAIRENEIYAAHRLAHTLKGNAGHIDMNDLQKAANDVEQMLKDGKNLVTKAQMNILENELTSALSRLELELTQEQDEENKKSQGQTAETKVLDAQSAQEIFSELEGLLKMGSPDSLKFIDKLRQLHGNNDAVEQLKNKLINNIEDFIFESAIDVLNELKNTLN
jgi:CheY-like chemotaxis protein